MKKESQVADLTRSKKLKELGIEIDSLFYWSKAHLSEGGYSLSQSQSHSGNNCPAPTATELMDVLPPLDFRGIEWDISKTAEVKTGKIIYEYEIKKNYFCGEWTDDQLLFGNDTNFANALCDMLIYLKENNLI